MLTISLLTKSKLGIILSKLEHFQSPKAKDEQYETDSETAAEILWNAYMNGDIEDRTIADLGCGTGILGLGATLLGAKKVYFIEKYGNVIEIAKRNAGALEKHIFNEITFIEKDIKGIKIHADIVIQNPPFGTKERHADKEFLEKAFSIANVIYSVHKIESRDFIEKIARNYNFTITHLYRFKLPIKATQKFHKKRIHRIDVGCWRLEKQLNI